MRTGTQMGHTRSLVGRFLHSRVAFGAGLLCVSWMAGLALAQSGGTSSAPQSREQASLVEEQELLAQKLSRVVGSMNRLADRFESEGRIHAAKLLRDGLQHISKRHEGGDGLTLEERMTGSHEKLHVGQSMQSIETQKQIITELESLISILMDRPDLDQLESEIERVQRQRGELQALANEEAQLREKTEALREDASNDAQRNLEAGIQAAQKKQRELLTENERQSRGGGALDLERLEQELAALLEDQHTDAEVFKEWDPSATAPLEAALQHLDQARREEASKTRLQKAAEELRAASDTQRPNADSRWLDDRAESARRAARASGDPSAKRAADALEEAAQSLRQAGEDAAARKEAAEQIGELASQLDKEAAQAKKQAATERAEARQALAPLEKSSSSPTSELAKALSQKLASADEPPSGGQPPADSEGVTLDTHRELRDALEQTKFLGQALEASQSENAERAEKLREGLERLPEDLGQPGQEAQAALEEAREAMRQAAQAAEQNDPSASTQSAERGEEALRKAQSALAKERESRAADPASPAAQQTAELAEAQEQLAKDVEQLSEKTAEAALAEKAQAAVEQALQEAAEAMQQASQEMSEGKSSSAAQSQRRASEALQKAGQEAREGVEPQTPEDKQRAEELAKEQERIEKELYEFQEQYEKERSKSSPDLESMSKAQASAAQAKKSLEQGDLDQAQQQEKKTEQEIQKAMDDLAKEEEQYQKLRDEELLFQIAEEVTAIREAHEQARLETEEIDQGRVPGERASRGQKLRLRKVARIEEALATRMAEIGKAIREEGSLVFAELIDHIERDLTEVSRRLGDAGGYRSDERVQALQADVTHYLSWLAEALEEERDRREEEQQEPQEGGEAPTDGENRLVPDVAELKLLARMEVDVLDNIEELLVLYPELKGEGAIDPLLLEEIQRLAHRHERSTELFSEFRARLGIQAPALDIKGGGNETDSGGKAEDTEE